MRVKRPKPDDLIDALKQLRIADRRSRLSLRGGRTTGSLALLGGTSLDQTFRCRLTRSASSTSAGIQHSGLSTSYLCDCCCTVGHNQTRLEPIDCVDCSVSRLNCHCSIQLGTSALPFPRVTSDALSASSGFSPFTTSAGLLYSTLPTTFEFRRGHAAQPNSHHLLQSDKLRRSCGTGLSHLDLDPVICGHVTTSTAQSRSSFGSVTTSNSDRHHYCIHHHHLTHLRLYRRLYSLIDHPCVSWHNSSRLLRCPHRNSIKRSGSVVGKYALHRHSLSHRHRRKTLASVSSQDNSRLKAQTIPSGLSSTVLQSDLTPVNCDRSVLEFHSASPNTNSVDALHDLGGVGDHYQFDCHSSNLGRNHPSSHLDNHRSCLQSGTNEVSNLTGSLFLSSQSTGLETENFGVMGCMVHGNITRCRRNSDPEHWQLIKMANSGEVKVQPHIGQISDRDVNEQSYSRPINYASTVSTAYRSVFTRSLQTDNQSLSGSSWIFGSSERTSCCRPSGNTTTYYRDSTSVADDATVYHSASAYSQRPISHDCLSRSALPSTIDSFQFHRQQQTQNDLAEKRNTVPRTLALRPSVLSTQITALSPTSSFHPEQCAKPCGDSTFSETAVHNLTKHIKDHRDNSCLLWDPGKISSGPFDSVGQNVPSQTQSTVATQSGDEGTSMQALQEEIALLEEADTTNGDLARSQLTSDISVNELAAYMEHMVHIPGRMSEMAQRMYL